MSLSDIKFVARTHARALCSSSGLMVVHFELVGHKKMSMTLEILVEMMSPTCFEEFIVRTQAWLPYSFPNRIFLQRLVLEKEYSKQNWELNIAKIVDKVVENLTQGR